jgi:hypothetical protein
MFIRLLKLFNMWGFPEMEINLNKTAILTAIRQKLVEKQWTFLNLLLGCG